MPSVWSDPEHVEEYLAREIPYRRLAEDLLIDALDERVERFLDLGTGDGRLLALVKQRHSAAHGVGIDASPPMLDRASERFAGDSSISLRRHDLSKPLTETGPFDAVVSALAIHHLDDDRKRALFRETHDVLAPGGVFADLDLTLSPTPSRHRRFREAIGRPQDDPEDRLSGLCEQLAWLREAGFGQVDCRFKWLELTLFVAVRRGPA